MQTFHNDPSIKAELVAQLKDHYEADEIIQGQYWQDGKGCAVGCCVHGNDHNLFPVMHGLPTWLAHLMDGIFEGLSRRQAKKFPLQVISAIPVGVDLTRVKHQFFHWLLVDPINGVARFNPHQSIIEVASLHRRVVDGEIVSDQEWSAVWSAAWSAAQPGAEFASRASAESAAWSAAWSAARPGAQTAAWSSARAAAWSAVRSAAESTAESAARAAVMSAVESSARSAVMPAARAAAESGAESAAESAAWSAAESAAQPGDWSSARSSARSAQAKKLIELLRAA